MTEEMMAIEREHASLNAEANADRMLMIEHPRDEAILKAVSRRSRARMAKLEELSERIG